MNINIKSNPAWPLSQELESIYPETISVLNPDVVPQRLSVLNDFFWNYNSEHLSSLNIILSDIIGIEKEESYIEKILIKKLSLISLNTENINNLTVTDLSYYFWDIISISSIYQKQDLLNELRGLLLDYVIWFDSSEYRQNLASLTDVETNIYFEKEVHNIFEELKNKEDLFLSWNLDFSKYPPEHLGKALNYFIAYLQREKKIHIWQDGKIGALFKNRHVDQQTFKSLTAIYRKLKKTNDFEKSTYYNIYRYFYEGFVMSKMPFDNNPITWKKDIFSKNFCKKYDEHTFLDQLDINSDLYKLLNETNTDILDSVFLISRENLLKRIFTESKKFRRRYEKKDVINNITKQINIFEQETKKLWEIMSKAHSEYIRSKYYMTPWSSTSTDIDWERQKQMWEININLSAKKEIYKKATEKYIVGWSKLYVKTIINLYNTVARDDWKLLPEFRQEWIAALIKKGKINTPFKGWLNATGVVIDFSEFSYSLSTNIKIDVENIVDEGFREKFSNWLDTYFQYICENPAMFAIDIWSIMAAATLTWRWSPLVITTRFFLLHKAIMATGYGVLALANQENIREWMWEWLWIYKRNESGELTYIWGVNSIIHLSVDFVSDLVFFKYIAPFASGIKKVVETSVLSKAIISAPSKSKILLSGTQFFTEVWAFTLLWMWFEPLEAGAIGARESGNLMSWLKVLDKKFTELRQPDKIASSFIYNMMFVWALRTGTSMTNPLVKRFVHKWILKKHETAIHNAISLETELRTKSTEFLARKWRKLWTKDGVIIFFDKSGKIIKTPENTLPIEIIDLNNKLNKELETITKTNLELIASYKENITQKDNASNDIKTFIEYVKKNKWDFISKTPEEIFKWRREYYVKKGNKTKSEYRKKIYKDFVKKGWIQDKYETALSNKLSQRIEQSIMTALWTDKLLQNLLNDTEAQKYDFVKRLTADEQTRKDKKIWESFILELNKSKNKELLSKLQELIASQWDPQNQIDLTRDIRRILRTETKLSDWMKRFIIVFVLSTTAASCGKFRSADTEFVQIDTLKVEGISELAFKNFKEWNYKESSKYDKVIWEMYEWYAREYEGSLTKEQKVEQRKLLRKAILHYNYASESLMRDWSLEAARVIFDKLISIVTEYPDIDMGIEESTKEYVFYTYNSMAGLLISTEEFSSAYEYLQKAMDITKYERNKATSLNDRWDALLVESDLQIDPKLRLKKREVSYKKSNEALLIKDNMKMKFFKDLDIRYKKYFDINQKDYKKNKEDFLIKLLKEEWWWEKLLDEIGKRVIGVEWWKYEKYKELFLVYEYIEATTTYIKFNKAKVSLLIAEAKELVNENEVIYSSEEITKDKSIANSIIDETIVFLEFIDKNLAEPYYYKWLYLEWNNNIIQAISFYEKSYNRSAPEAKEKSNLNMRVYSSNKLMHYRLSKSLKNPTVANLKEANKRSRNYTEAEAVEAQQIKEQRETTQKYKSALDRKTKEASLAEREKEQRDRIIRWIATIAFLSLIWWAVLVKQIKNKNKAYNLLWDKTEELEKQTIELEKTKWQLEVELIASEESEKLANYLLNEKTKSMDAGKLVQEAIMPTKEWLSKILPQSFLLFKPKDEISWDFYRYAEVDWKKIAIVMDCVWHSVMWWMVSMLWNNFLNTIVKQKKITDPAKILEELNNWFRDAFIKDDNVSKNILDRIQHYTMDGTIIVVDSKAKTLSFAWANNPPLLVKNNWEVSNFKKDKIIWRYSIDGKPWKEYKKATIPYEDWDMFYMRSDWFPDTFWWEYWRKFMTKNLRNLLASNAKKPISTQFSILNSTLDKRKQGKWLGQQDDVTVMGICLWLDIKINKAIEYCDQKINNTKDNTEKEKYRHIKENIINKDRRNRTSTEDLVTIIKNSELNKEDRVKEIEKKRENQSKDKLSIAQKDILRTIHTSLLWSWEFVFGQSRWNISQKYKFFVNNFPGYLAKNKPISKLTDTEWLERRRYDSFFNNLVETGLLNKFEITSRNTSYFNITFRIDYNTLLRKWIIKEDTKIWYSKIYNEYFMGCEYLP